MYPKRGLHNFTSGLSIDFGMVSVLISSMMGWGCLPHSIAAGFLGDQWSVTGMGVSLRENSPHSSDL